MAGYENLLAIVSHSGPPIYGCQALRLKIINMNDQDYRTILETDCPISHDGVLTWLGFTEEGQFMTLDTEGVLRSFSFKNQQWTPVLDFKIKHSEIYDKLWITGITEGEVLAIEMASSQQAVPLLTQKTMIRRFKLKVPLLNQDMQEGSKDGLPQFEEQLLRSSMELEHN